MHLPAELRGVAAAATQVTRHPLVSEIVSAGVLAAVAALAENEKVRRAARSAGDEAGEAAEDAARTDSRAKVAVKAAAGAMGQRLLDEVKGTAEPRNTGKTKAKAKEPASAD